MKLYDISVGIRPDLPVWEGDPPVMVERMMRIEDGDGANLTLLDMSAHTGTHVDAPVHFLSGRKGIDQLDLDALIGPAVVVEFDTPGEIGAADLEKACLPAGTTRLICKTRNSRLWSERPNRFFRGFTGIALDGARWLVEHGIRLVGIDYLGVEGYESVERGAPVHRLLLDAEVVLLEGLDLSGIAPGEYTLVCLPVKIIGSDGAPARAVLMRE